jgi:calcium/calmodulin-dependent protein kinase I
VKIIDRKDTGVNVESVTDKEIQVMLKIDDEHCVKLYEIYQTDEQVQLVMELMHGRDLFDRVITRKKYSELNAKKLMWRACHGVKYLHDQKIIHRDLKPENILLCHADEDTECKVGDFGLSKLFPEEANDLQTHTLCGTPGYVAPEVLNRQPYGVKIDVWSLGVIAYITLCGFPPFPLDMAANSVKKVKGAEFTYPMPQWQGISDQAKDFISGMIVVDVEQRMSMVDVLAHPWLQDGAPAECSQ